jgi:hypothetical protein
MTFQRRSNRLTAALATGICASALAAPAALAAPDIGPVSRDDDGAAPEPAPLIVRVPDEGFDWGSAAVGAGSAGALVVLVSLGGVAFAARHRAPVVR